MSPSSCDGIETTSWQELVFFMTGLIIATVLRVVQSDVVFLLFQKNNKRILSLARKVGVLFLQSTIRNTLTD
jgi:hypothetical protein